MNKIHNDTKLTSHTRIFKEEKDEQYLLLSTVMLYDTWEMCTINQNIGEPNADNVISFIIIIIFTYKAEKILGGGRLRGVTHAINRSIV